MPGRGAPTTMGSMHGQTASVLLTTHDPAGHATGAVITGLIIGIVIALVLFVAVVAWWARRGGSDDPGDDRGGGVDPTIRATTVGGAGAGGIRPTRVRPDRRGGRSSSASSPSMSPACNQGSPSRPHHSDVITPLVMSRAPMAVAPMTAAVRPLRAIQALNRVTLSRVRS